MRLCLVQAYKFTCLYCCQMNKLTLQCFVEFAVSITLLCQSIYHYLYNSSHYTNLIYLKNPQMDKFYIELLVYTSGVVQTVCSILLLFQNKKIKNSSLKIIVFIYVTLHLYYLDPPTSE